MNDDEFEALVARWGVVQGLSAEEDDALRRALRQAQDDEAFSGAHAAHWQDFWQLIGGLVHVGQGYASWSVGRLGVFGTRRV